MNRSLFFIFFYIFIILNFTKAQQTLNSSWTWISGSNTYGQVGIYGTKGIANSSNIPGARSDSISWIDSNNNLWLFGGIVSNGGNK